MSANTGVYGDSPDMTEGTSVDPHPIREREPLPGALQGQKNKRNKHMYQSNVCINRLKVINQAWAWSG